MFAGVIQISQPCYEGGKLEDDNNEFLAIDVNAGVIAFVLVCDAFCKGFGPFDVEPEREVVRAPPPWTQASLKDAEYGCLGTT